MSDVVQNLDENGVLEHIRMVGGVKTVPVAVHCGISKKRGVTIIVMQPVRRRLRG